VTIAQNRNLPLATQAATPASAAANAYIPGQSHSMKKPKKNRITALVRAILLMLAFTEKTTYAFGFLDAFDTGVEGSQAHREFLFSEILRGRPRDSNTFATKEKNSQRPESC
jgi:hypothetical protein